MADNMARSTDMNYAVFMFKDEKEIVYVPITYLKGQSCAWPLSCKNFLDFKTVVKKYPNPESDNWAYYRGKIIRTNLAKAADASSQDGDVGNKENPAKTAVPMATGNLLDSLPTIGQDEDLNSLNDEEDLDGVKYYQKDQSKDVAGCDIPSKVTMISRGSLSKAWI
ncbi:Hypothetical predicted protein [Cloeon dipterum]|uniref:Uncharacterized protein n=1 Tax=Cloeon dipterum TaxID=197152 RepID=A0A8S1E6Y8_9INSE|nr:Hypothetical predicted protein [Cloeon dipterum]